MADPVSLEEQQYRGDRAAKLLNDPLMVEAFQAVKTEILQMWEQAPARDVEAREWLWKLYQAQIRFENVFKGYVDTGKVAADQLKHKQSLQQKVVNAFRG